MQSNGNACVRGKKSRGSIWLACANIGTPRRNLKALVRVSFHTLHDLESCCSQMLLDPCALIENEIERNLLLPELVDMAHLISHMKGQQHLSARSQHAPELTQHGGYLGWRNVDDRVESCNAAPARVGHRKRRHVPNMKLDTAVELPRQLNHARRKIHTQHLRALLVEITSNMPWPAAQIADEARVSQHC